MIRITYSGYRLIKLTCLLLVSLFVSACVYTDVMVGSSTTKVLNKNDQAKISSLNLDVVVGFGNGRIVKPYATGGNSGQQLGLLGYLLESAIANGINNEKTNRERLVAPLQTAVLKLNWGSRLRESIEHNVTEIPQLSINSISKAPLNEQRNISQIIQTSTGDNVLIINMRYEFLDDLSALVTNTYMTLYARTPLSGTNDDFQQPEYPTLYNRLVKSEYLLSTDSNQHKPSLDVTADQYAVEIKHGLTIATSELTQQLLRDLSISN